MSINVAPSQVKSLIKYYYYTQYVFYFIWFFFLLSCLGAFHNFTLKTALFFNFVVVVIARVLWCCDGIAVQFMLIFIMLDCVFTTRSFFFFFIRMVAVVFYNNNFLLQPLHIFLALTPTLSVELLFYCILFKKKHKSNFLLSEFLPHEFIYCDLNENKTKTKENFSIFHYILVYIKMVQDHLMMALNFVTRWRPIQNYHFGFD